MNFSGLSKLSVLLDKIENSKIYYISDMVVSLLYILIKLDDNFSLKIFSGQTSKQYYYNLYLIYQ